MGYLKDLKDAAKTSLKGLGITTRHLGKAIKQRPNIGVQDDDYFKVDEGLMTLQYPHEDFKVPENGRYKLHNEIDDCIVCDKCAKICPVDCIDIEPVRSPEPFGTTSDGTPKRIYAAKFDIDMGKCCFCGLCTTVCPTECLTMTPEYDYSVNEIEQHVFSFANMTPEEIEEKVNIWNKYEEEKKASAESKPSPEKPKAGRPNFKPKFKRP